MLGAMLNISKIISVFLCDLVVLNIEGKKMAYGHTVVYLNVSAQKITPVINNYKQ